MSSTPPPPPPPGDNQGPDGSGPGDMPRYPSAPQMPEASAPQRPQVPKPQPVRIAVWLMWVGAAIALISLVLGAVRLSSLDKAELRDQLEASTGDNVTQSMVDAAYLGAAVFAIGIGVIGLLLWLWMAWKNGQGRSWARVLATVLAGLNVLVVLFALMRGAGGVTISQIVNLALAIVIVVLLWRPESSQFFNAGKQRPS